MRGKGNVVIRLEIVPKKKVSLEGIKSDLTSEEISIVVRRSHLTVTKHRLKSLWGVIC